MKLDRIYAALPVRMQDLACSAVGYRLNHRRYSGEYRDIERDALDRESWPADRMAQFVNERLRLVVRHAVEHVPYYRRTFARLKIDPRDIRTASDLGALPVLDKRTVQENLSDFISEQKGLLACTTVHTSGTTGAGLIFPMSLAGEREQWAACWRYRQRFGVTRRTWYAHFFGKSVVPVEQERPPFWRTNRAGRQILFSAYHMTPACLGYYVEELNRRKPPMIQGYPSLLALLAAHMVESGVRLDYQPRAIMCSSESLLPHQGQIIERAFGTRCRQLYSLTEGAASITECPEGRLHIDEDYAHLEFLPVSDGAYRLIGTVLTNFAFPLLRYDTGDVVELNPSEKPCRCGRASRTVKSIDGRIEDYVLTPDGRKIGRLDHIFKDMVGVRECQIVQEEVDRLIFRVVRGPSYTRGDEAALLTEAKRRLGPRIVIELRYEDRIERTSRGKLRFVVSRLPECRVDTTSRSTAA